MNFKKDMQRKVYTSLIDGKAFSLPYRLYVPADYQTKQYPLVVFLHGYGECGKDNIKQMFYYGFYEAIEKNGEEAIVFAPQTVEDEKWSDFNTTRNDYLVNKPFTAGLKSAIKMINNIISGYNVDRNRIYVSGLSMGGGGSLEIFLRMPNTFACVMPICPACVFPHDASMFKDTNIWLFHGDSDRTIDVKQSLEFDEALNNEGIPHRITIYPGVDHPSWMNAFKEDEFIKFMFSSRLGEYNKYLK